MFKKLKLWFSINNDKIFYRKVLYETTKKFYDHYWSYDCNIKISRVISLKGIYYQASTTNCTMNDKNKYRLFTDMMYYMNESSPAMSRLEDRLNELGVQKKIWNIMKKTKMEKKRN